MLEEDSNDLDFPSEDIKINSISIEEISDPVLPNRKRKKISKLDFFLEL